MVAQNLGFEVNNSMDFDTDKNTVRLEVDADGAWELEIYPLAADYIIKKAEIPTTISGNNNDIIWIVGQADLIIVKSTGDSNFFVYGYDENGNSEDLIVNEISPFDGKYIIPQGVSILVIEAEGDWTMEFTAR